ncbi:hypothetical protein EK21DRAFT_117814 [Setomelanomma holmii]|uniref:Uncharacterized protein n=1 Tax=Setomelanomma holmii TaxID=210430 RepID=A0A9P4LHQ0_9PLEO|nr:hypothetical protein EK21DRAFT_117814 [Setomelanomma holmii]
MPFSHNEEAELPPYSRYDPLPPRRLDDLAPPDFIARQQSPEDYYSCETDTSNPAITAVDIKAFMPDLHSNRTPYDRIHTTLRRLGMSIYPHIHSASRRLARRLQSPGWWMTPNTDTFPRGTRKTTICGKSGCDTTVAVKREHEYIWICVKRQIKEMETGREREWLHEALKRAERHDGGLRFKM